MRRLFERAASFLFVVALALRATTAAGDVIIMTNNGFELAMTDPVAVGSGVENLRAVTLYVTNLNAGGDVEAFPSSFSGGIGLGGNLHHEQFFSPIPPPFGTVLTTPTATSAGGSTVDSHFIRDPRVSVNAPAEPAAPDASSAEPGDFGGLGSRTGFVGPLTADVGFFDAVVVPDSPRLDIARLVGVQDSIITFDFQIGTATAGLDRFFEGQLQLSTQIVDMEPPTLDMIEITRDLRDGPPAALVQNLQLLATDNVSAPEALVWSNLMYDVDNSAGNNSGADGGSLGGDGVFNWNPVGWRRGMHFWKATVTDEAGNSTAGVALKVNLIVPEPATVSLLGLALVGLVGLGRRRS